MEEQKKAILMEKEAETNRKNAPNKASQLYFEAAKKYCCCHQLKDSVKCLTFVLRIQNNKMDLEDEKNAGKSLIVLKSRMMIARLLKNELATISEQIYEEIVEEIIGKENLGRLCLIFSKGETLKEMMEVCLEIYRRIKEKTSHFSEYHLKETVKGRYEKCGGIGCIVSVCLEEIATFLSRNEMTSKCFVCLILTAVINIEENWKREICVVMKKLSETLERNCFQFYACESWKVCLENSEDKDGLEWNRTWSGLLMCCLELDDKSFFKKMIENWKLNGGEIKNLIEESKVCVFFQIQFYFSALIHILKPVSFEIE